MAGKDDKARSTVGRGTLGHIAGNQRAERNDT